MSDSERDANGLPAGQVMVMPLDIEGKQTGPMVTYGSWSEYLDEYHRNDYFEQLAEEFSYEEVKRSFLAEPRWEISVEVRAPKTVLFLEGLR